MGGRNKHLSLMENNSLSFSAPLDRVVHLDLIDVPAKIIINFRWYMTELVAKIENRSQDQGFKFGSIISACRCIQHELLYCFKFYTKP